MNDVQNRYPDVTTALTAFFRNTIRAIAATDSTNDILAMRDDFIEIERHLDAHGPGLYLFFTFTQAINQVIAHERGSEFLEAQFDLGLSAMKHLVEISSSDHNRNRRIPKSSKRLRESLEWLDEVRAIENIRQKSVFKKSK